MTRSRLVVSFIFILLAFAGVTLWRSTMREAATEADYPPEGQIVTVDGVRMHVVARGKGPDLVLIHGASGSLRDLTFSLVPALAARYRVIVVDRPGLGWSDAASDSDSLSSQARLIRAVAAGMGAARPVVMGHSYGGAVALAWAVDAPDAMSALVLVSPVSHPWDGGVDRIYTVTGHPVLGPAVVTALSAWLPADYVTRQTEDVFLPQPAPLGYAEHFGPMMSTRAATLAANARQRLTLKAEVAAQSQHYPQIGVPVEVLHGDADPITFAQVHSERVADDVPGARLTILPGIGHMPHHVAQADVIAAIDRAAARAGLSSASDPMQ